MYYATSPEVTRFTGIMTACISVWESGIDVSVFMSTSPSWGLGSKVFSGSLNPKAKSKVRSFKVKLIQRMGRKGLYASQWPAII